MSERERERERERDRKTERGVSEWVCQERHTHELVQEGVSFAECLLKLSYCLSVCLPSLQDQTQLQVNLS